MSGNEWDHEFYEVMKTEHEDLVELLQNVRNAITSKNRTRVELEDSISSLCELVEVYFSHQEQEVYFKKMLSRSPRLRSQAEILRNQHQILHEEVEKLRILAHSGVESEAWWIRVESDFHKFADHLMTHEQAELKLVESAAEDNSQDEKR